MRRFVAAAAIGSFRRGIPGRLVLGIVPAVKHVFVGDLARMAMACHFKIGYDRSSLDLHHSRIVGSALSAGLLLGIADSRLEFHDGPHDVLLCRPDCRRDVRE